MKSAVYFGKGFDQALLITPLKLKSCIQYFMYSVIKLFAYIWGGKSSDSLF